ncbi:sugar phosphate permease [Frigoribacterium sp. PhB160]|uniref:MFS transporter n=1 Tax=Frigoribacterium sp. PhB160 TaxID=2485192 RepID=UPI000F48A0AC|nr:MFS transporter [Frigoribacterium sp. PhB160]ROS59260.1 sugar phosphate permease [Frigoribacterium sp. PhB160]
MTTASPAPADGASPPVSRRSLIKAFTASLTGTSLEWYDFAVYSAASAVVFPSVFFPSSDPYTATILAFSTYAVGYVSRPIGGFVFGRLGDKLGRKPVLVTTLLVIGIATFLIGVLPGYATIGLAAPILLVLLRFAQGVGVGGEWGGAVLLSSEFGNPRRRGFWSSAAQVGPPAGNLLANGALALLTAVLTEDAFLDWGWRLAFLLSAVLVGFGLYIRLKLEDTPVFQALEARGDAPAAPVREVFSTQLRPLVAAILCRIGPDVTYALFTVFTLTYGTTALGLERSQVLVAVLIGSAFQLVSIPLAGALSDLINRRLLYAVAAVGAAVWSFVFFVVTDGSSTVVLTIGIVLGLVFHSLMYGPQAAFIIEQFSPRLRSTGSSLAYTIAGVFGGAIAPLMFTIIYERTGSGFGIALYLTVAVALTLIGLALGRDSDVREDEEYLTGPTPVVSGA